MQDTGCGMGDCKELRAEGKKHVKHCGFRNADCGFELQKDFRLWNVECLTCKGQRAEGKKHAKR